LLVTKKKKKEGKGKEKEKGKAKTNEINLIFYGLRRFCAHPN
jgi:hypothetical protein